LPPAALPHAAAGSFTEAVTTAEKALRLAKTLQQKITEMEIRNRLELYKASRPYIELSPK